MAVNQELAYVYVKLRDMVEVASLNHVAPVVAVHNRDGQLLARVGVYTNTRVGGRLLNQQMHMLRQQGYEAELVAGSNWSASASKG
jgi:predicted N-acetyltransferase YhbS